MKHLFIDIETYSAADLNKTGVYRYTLEPDFKILLFGYSVDGESVKVVDLASGEHIPLEITEALLDDAVTKSAFNAMFERVCLSRFLGMQDGWDTENFSLQVAGTAIWYGRATWVFR